MLLYKGNASYYCLSRYSCCNIRTPHQNLLLHYKKFKKKSKSTSISRRNKQHKTHILGRPPRQIIWIRLHIRKLLIYVIRRSYKEPYRFFYNVSSYKFPTASKSYP